MTSNEPKKIPPVVKWLAAGMSAVLCAHGIFIIATQYYVGRARHGVQTIVEGPETLVLGIAIIIIGLTPMALWAKSPKAAGFWAGGCMTLGILLFLAPSFIR